MVSGSVIGGGRGCSGRASAMPWWGRVGVVVVFEFAQGVEEVALVPDQGAVQQFASAGLYPAFHGRVHPRHPDPVECGLVPRVLMDGVEQVGVLPVAVADHEPGQAAGILEIHDEVPGGLRRRGGGRVRRRAQDADAPAGVPDHREHVQPRPGQGDRFEEVTCQQGHRPGSAGSPSRYWNPARVPAGSRRP